MRSRSILLTLSVVALLATAGGVALLLKRQQERRIASEVVLARRDLGANRPNSASERLETLVLSRPSRSDLQLLLAESELARGRTEKALAALERVAPGSNEAGVAATVRSRILIQKGRLDEAEQNLRATLQDIRNQKSESLPAARDALVRLLRSEGRFTEARGVYVEGIRGLADPLIGLKGLYKLDVDPIGTDGLRVYLDNSRKRNPDDDRVWLGFASLETRLGHFEEAERWLNACQAKRPEDLAVWQARLQWAKEAERPADVLESLKHLPADPIEAEAVRAWFAAQRGDAQAETQALLKLAKLKPGDATVLSRLAELHAQAGKPEEAATYRQTIRQLNKDRDAYEAALNAKSRTTQQSANAAMIARKLGLEYEASLWESLAQGKPNGPSPPVHPASKPSLTLAALVPELLTYPNVPIQKAGSNTSQAVVRFRDDAEAAGLRFVHENGARAEPSRLIPPISASGGVGLIDYDSDGWLDVYCVQSGPFPQGFGNGTGESDRLFRNQGNGQFEDLSVASGISTLARGYGHGLAVGDYDSDGLPDLFLTRWRSYTLLRNRGDGTFEDVTARASLDGDRDWPTSAAFADLDNDGDLDLYVCHYFRWDENDIRTCADPDNPGAYHCTPLAFEARQDHLFRNDRGVYVDISGESGIAEADVNGRGLGVLAADLDGDHLVDLFVANDMSSNYFFKNLGNLRFAEIALGAGVATNASGAFQAGMGTACGDLDGDGRPDLVVTNFYNESTSFFRNLSDGIFADQTRAIGLAASSRDLLGFGVALPDFNNDGRLDFISVNGHIHDGRPQFPFLMRVQVCLNGESGKLAEIDPEASAEVFKTEHLGRGLAVGDLDNDGKVDALVLSQNEPLAYLHNLSEQAGHSLTLKLVGLESNRDGVGATIAVQTRTRRQVFQRVGGGSYQSASDPRIHVGLGLESLADAIEIQWPSGRTGRYENLAADTGYLIREGAESVEPLTGFSRTSP